MVEGYLIYNQKLQLLTYNYFWISSDRTEGYVFTKEQVLELKETSANWDTKPVLLIPATYNGSKVMLTGHPIMYI